MSSAEDQIHASTLVSIAAQMRDGIYQGDPPLEKPAREGAAMEAWQDIIEHYGQDFAYADLIEHAPEAAPMSYSLLTQAMEPPSAATNVNLEWQILGGGEGKGHTPAGAKKEKKAAREELEDERKARGDNPRICGKGRRKMGKDKEKDRGCCCMQ